MKLRMSQLLSAATLLALSAGAAQAAVVITASGSAIGAPPAHVTDDLGETEYLSSSFTGGNEGSEHQQLFDGADLGNTDGGTGNPGEVRLTSGETITLNLDVSTNTLGYDITGIDTIAGWDTLGGGRSNQGYSVTVTFMDDSTAEIVPSAHHAPNSPTADYWTTVSITDDDTGVLASGVKSITWDITFNANPGSVVIYREFDVFGSATVPEPGSLALLGLGGLLIARRRRNG